ncbi:MAG: protein kinase [Cyanobacteria bacterium J06621_8]
MDHNLAGKTIQGRYYVVKQLGRGGVGVTFLARDRQCFDSPCVVKQLKPRTPNPRTLAIARRLFNKEAEVMNRLGHCDRIPRLLAYFEHENEFFLVQELIEGHDLSQEIIAGQPWEESKTIDFVQDVLEVLLVVQQNSVIHRDLKPSNLMRRSQDGNIILIDFGSVKQVSTQIFDPAGQGKPTVAVGTKFYMPMEQMMGHPGFYSDIYALGAIAIQALTGVEPRKFKVNDQGELIWRDCLNSQIHYQPRFLDILDQMICYRYQERYGNAQAVLADLQQLDVTQNNTKDTIIIAHRSKANASNNKAESNPHRENIVNQTNSRTAAEKSLNHQPVIDETNLLTKSPPERKVIPSPKQSRSWLLPLTLGSLTALSIAWGGWLLWKQQSNESEIEQVYENSDQGFRINYPNAWLSQNRDDFFTSGVVFLSPLENNSDQFKEQVSVLVENVADNTSLAQYTEQSLVEIKRLSDPNIDVAVTANLGRELGRQVTYSGEANGSAVRRMQTWSIKDNQAYIVTYTAQPESYEAFLPTVEKMIESFVIVSN